MEINYSFFSNKEVDERRMSWLDGEQLPEIIITLIKSDTSLWGSPLLAGEDRAKERKEWLTNVQNPTIFENLLSIVVGLAKTENPETPLTRFPLFDLELPLSCAPLFDLDIQRSLHKVFEVPAAVELLKTAISTAHSNQSLFGSVNRGLKSPADRKDAAKLLLGLIPIANDQKALELANYLLELNSDSSRFYAHEICEKPKVFIEIANDQDVIRQEIERLCSLDTRNLSALLKKKSNLAKVFVNQEAKALYEKAEQHDPKGFYWVVLQLDVLLDIAKDKIALKYANDMLDIGAVGCYALCNKDFVRLANSSDVRGWIDPLVNDKVLSLEKVFTAEFNGSFLTKIKTKTGEQKEHYERLLRKKIYSADTLLRDLDNPEYQPDYVAPNIKPPSAILAELVRAAGGIEAGKIRAA